MTGERHCYDELEHDTALLMTGEGDRELLILCIECYVTSLKSSDQTLQVFLIGGGSSLLFSLFDTCGGES